MKFRQDIQGLRAVAVLLVIFHHAFPSALPGGYIGVDIFFVISGFLITGLLIKDAERKGSQLLLDFYARRVRRILPMALIGIMFGTIFAQTLLGPVLAADARQDGFFALLFLANWHFNNVAVDYFAAGLPASLFQHYWSLAVEEQFYLIWPLLIVWSRRWRTGPLVTIGLVSLSSFVFSVIQSENGSATAFLATETRIWELGLGALLSILGKSRANQRFSTLLILVLIALAIRFNSETGFPGLPAFVVVLSTILLIITSESNRLLKSKPLVFLGDISFSLYIWHWILIQGANLYLPQPPSISTSALLLTGTLVLASLSLKIIENPIRNSSYLKSKPKLTLMVALLTLISSTTLLKLMEVWS